MTATITQLIVAALCLAPPLGRDCLPPPPPVRVVQILVAARRRKRKRRRTDNPSPGGRLNGTPHPRHHRTEQRECR